MSPTPDLSRPVQRQDSDIAVLQPAGEEQGPGDTELSDAIVPVQQPYLRLRSIPTNLAHEDLGASVPVSLLRRSKESTGCDRKRVGPAEEVHVVVDDPVAGERITPGREGIWRLRDRYPFTGPDSLILRVPCLLGGCCDDVVAPRYRGAGLTLPDSGAWCLYEDLSACPPGAGVGFRLWGGCDLIGALWMARTVSVLSAASGRRPRRA